MLKAKIDDSWDWIIYAVSDTALEAKRTRRECTPYQIAKTYAMKVYYDSYEPNPD